MKWPGMLTIEESAGMLVKKKIFLNPLYLPEESIKISVSFYFMY